ncbi:MAG: DUF2877 domain-containing protein [Betaproteobacteria bacterium]|nr:DUF2877 domain-containing protein [Betaproteobacteria bacterium]
MSAGLLEARALEVLRVGERARAALERSGGTAAALDGLEDGPYFRAAGELVWVGARLPAMHPRAVVTARPRERGSKLRIAALPERGWEAHLPEPGDPAALGAAATRLRGALARCDTPRGFGLLLAGGAPGFPLSPGVDAVRRLSAAIERDDPHDALAAARPLLGFGTGFTPAGDDVVGALLFARRFVAPRDARWTKLAETLAAEVAARSHPVSAALFQDLARGQSFAPLHEAAQALAAGREGGALAAARALAAIGHSSGWDMLTGFLIGIGAALAG